MSMTTIVSTAAEANAESGVAPEVWGIGALAVFFTLLLVTLIFGKGRPHA